MPTAAMQMQARIKQIALRRCIVIVIVIIVITAFMMIGSLLSDVHWITDVISGALLSSDLVLTYKAAIGTVQC